jgi:hypothetical protein
MDMCCVHLHPWLVRCLNVWAGAYAQLERELAGLRHSGVDLRAKQAEVDAAKRRAQEAHQRMMEAERYCTPFCLGFATVRAAGNSVFLCCGGPPTMPLAACWLPAYLLALPVNTHFDEAGMVQQPSE